jgi:CRISPR/Cas system-associated endonuclease/helicase Cas3
LEVQKKNLEKISEELEQDPKRIRKHLLSIIGTLNRINNFKELVEEDLQRKIEAVESDIRGKVSSSVQTIVDQYSSDYRIHFAQVD